MYPFRTFCLAVLLLFSGLTDVNGASVGSRARLIEVAISQLHVREATGRNDGSQVARFLKAIFLPEGYPWCSAFVVWCFYEAGIKVPRYGAARSWAKAPHHIIARNGKASEPVLPGDLVLFKWGNAQVAHVGFCELWGTKATAKTLEGNTSGGKLDRDGQGVYRNWRLKSQITYVVSIQPFLK